MYGCVTSPYSLDTARGHNPFLNAVCRQDDSNGHPDSCYTELSGCCFLGVPLKDEDSFPSSSTHPGHAPATTACDVASTDEHVITSSTRSVTPSPPLLKVKEQQALNSPPDDVRAFFGHPLTRATNILNGQEADTQAEAEALLHEYISLNPYRSQLRASQKVPRLIDVISGQRTNLALSSSELISATGPMTGDSEGGDTANRVGDLASPPQEQDELMNSYDKKLRHDDMMPFDKKLQPDDLMVFDKKLRQSDMAPFEKKLQESFKQTGEQRNSLTKYILLPEDFPLELMQEQDTDVMEVTAVLESGVGGGPAIKRRRCMRPKKDPSRQTTEPRPRRSRPARTSRSKSAVVSSTTANLPEELTTPSSGIASSSVFTTEAQSGITFNGNIYPTQQPFEGIAFGGIGSRRGEGFPSTETNTSTTTTSSYGLAVVKEETVETSCTQSPDFISNPRVTTVLQKGVDCHSSPCSINSNHAQDANGHAVLTKVDPFSCSTFPPLQNSSLPTYVFNTVACSSTVVTSHSNSPNSSFTINSSSDITMLKDATHDQVSGQVKDNSLKKALSEKIRSRQPVEDSTFFSLPEHSVQIVVPNETYSVQLEDKFPAITSVKLEDPYTESYEQQYTYSDLSHSLGPLPDYQSLSALTTNEEPQLINTITLDDNCHATHLTGRFQPETFQNNHRDSIHIVSLQPPPRDQYHPSDSSNPHKSSLQILDTGVEEPPQDQYYQELQPMRPFEYQVASAESSLGELASNYQHLYQTEANTHLLDTDKQEVVERYLRQQQQVAFGGGYQHFLAGGDGGTYSMQSPDSGYQEPCLSPGSAPVVHKELLPENAEEETKDRSKRRKTVSADKEGVSWHLTTPPGPTRTEDKTPAILKLKENNSGYSYFLETPISTTQPKNEDRVTYLNKSQYYGLSLEFNKDKHQVPLVGVKSLIVLAFREEKSLEDEKRSWEFWHGRQHSYKQRILDIDTKNCCGVVPQNIEEVAFNAVAIKWNPAEGPVRVNVAVHCLSTDFSNQKGVKGIPLHIQIDTYEQQGRDVGCLVHRGYCQIKAFCDKGAERKTRDEERRKASKVKPEEPANPAPTGRTKGRRRTEEDFHESCERSEFYSMADLRSAPVFFNPLQESSEFVHKSISLGVLPSQEDEITSLPTSLELPDSCDDSYAISPAPVKRTLTDSSTIQHKDQPKVLLYVREHHETVFTALMLEVPTLQGLLQSIEQKFSISPERVRNFYKKSKKGILVKLDDNIVRHYSHEATFIIEMTLLHDSGDYEIVLVEIDPSAS